MRENAGAQDFASAADMLAQCRQALPYALHMKPNTLAKRFLCLLSQKPEAEFRSFLTQFDTHHRQQRNFLRLSHRQEIMLTEALPEREEQLISRRGLLFVGSFLATSCSGATVVTTNQALIDKPSENRMLFELFSALGVILSAVGLTGMVMNHPHNKHRDRASKLLEENGAWLDAFLKQTDKILHEALRAREAGYTWIENYQNNLANARTEGPERGE